MSEVIGIPDVNKKTDPREAQFEEWEGVIHHHMAERAGEHFDLRLGDPKTGIAHSWALRHLPEPGEKTLAIQQPDHSIPYMDFSGVIGPGYGAGKVTKAFRGKVEVLKSNPTKVDFNIYKGHESLRFNLVKTGFGWLLVNSTATDKSRPEIPLYKASYPETQLQGMQVEDGNKLYSPKIDGAHNIISLRKGKPIEVFSYRTSKGPHKIIDHTFRTDLYKTMTPDDVANTILRGEFFGVNSNGKVMSATETGGLLNSEVWKSRATGNKIDNIIFDVVKYKGKNMENSPYAEKIKVLQEISKKVPQLKMAPLATTIPEKEQLMKSILDETHPLTREGVVIYHLDKSIPTKAKVRKDIDVYFVKPFEGKGRLKDNMAGGFLASRKPNGEPIIRVGGGLSDDLRRQMWEHPEKFKGRLAKIYIQHEYPRTGKVRAPNFKEWRTD